MAVGAIAALGLGLSVGGTIIGVMGAQKQAAAMKDAEKARRQQMELDAQRRQQELIRHGIVARATVDANAANQGVGLGSSAVIGGEQSVTTQQNRDTHNVSQNLELGRNIFSANMRSADAGSQMAFGSGMSSLGGALMQNQGPLNTALGIT